MDEDRDASMREKLLGFGEASVHKSYYPQLRQRLEELELFLAALDRANDLVFLVDMGSGLIRKANATACVSLGPAGGDLAGARFLDLFVLDRLDGPTSLSAAILEAGGVFDVRPAQANAPGAVFELTVSPVTVGATRVAVGVARDVTQRRADQLALRRSEERFRAIFNSVSDLIIVHEMPSGAILDVNRSVTDLLGYVPSELRAHGVGLFSHGEPPYDEARALEHMRAAMSGQARTMPWLCKSRDGRPIWLEISLRRALLAESPCLLVSGRDITARKAAEEELGRTRLVLQGVLDSMPSAVAGVDRERRVTSWNRAAAQLTGLDEEKALGRRVEDVLPLPEGALGPLGETLCQGRPFSRPFMRTVDGQARHQELQVFPFSGLEGVDGAVIRLDDVTERVRMQETMLQAEKMMSVGGLAAGMAHEINNPLAGILLNIQNLERRLLTDLPANRACAEHVGIELEGLRRYAEGREIPSLLRTARQSGERAARIVSNMLSFSRPGSSAHVPADLALLVDRVLEIASSDYNLTRKYDFRRIRVLREFQSDMPQVPCSCGEMEQVLLNLLLNAAQALFGYRAVAQPCIVIRLRVEGGYAHVEVEDNGPGMSDALRRRVFEPFVTTKQPGEGTGLGLSVAYFIVTNNHRGQFQVLSEPGKGTRFVVRLPLAQAAGAAPK